MSDPVTVEEIRQEIGRQEGWPVHKEPIETFLSSETIQRAVIKGVDTEILVAEVRRRGGLILHSPPVTPTS